MKKFLGLLLVALFAFSVAACEPTEEDPTCDADQELVDGECVDIPEEDTTAPTISGVEDVTVYKDSDFDALDGVTATDNVDGDVTSDIVVAGTVDITTTGTYFLRYSVEDAAGNKREETRYVTVEIDPSLIGDEMVPNGDFELGWTIWSTTTGLEGGNANYSVVDGELVVEVTSVSGGLWEPRLENIGIEFENGKTYEVSFDARAEEPRAIHLQVGEILPAAPWFANFKPGQTEIFDLSTEMETYSFKFTMSLDTNANGALIFEMGTVPANELEVNNLVTTVYLDNVVITEAVPDPDTTPPTITGAGDVNVELNSEFDPMEGVTVFDTRDGAITLTDANIIGSVDTSVEGEYRIGYLVTDSAGNAVYHDRYVTVVSLIFNETTDVTDPSFDTTTEIIAEVQDPDAGYADITDAEIWYQYTAAWDGAAASFSVVEGAASVDITAAGNNDWGIMLKQKGINLVEGYTYKLQFDASSTVARDIVAKVSDEYGVTVNLTEDMKTYEFIFTHEAATVDNERILFLLGNTPLFAASTVTIDNVNILLWEESPAPLNGDFEETGYWVWSQDWDQGSGIPTVTYEVVEGQMEVTTDLLGDANWAIQFIQENLTLVSGTTYRLTFDAMADTVRFINPKIIAGGEYFETVALTSEMTTYTFEFTYTGEDTETGKLSIEMGVITVEEVASVPGTVTLDNIYLEEVVEEVVIEGSNIMLNPTMTELLDWGVWGQDWDEGAGLAEYTYSIETGEFVIDITNLGSYNWSLQLFQEGIDLTPGATYTISFVAKADIARDINFKLIDTNNAEILEVASLTTEYQTFTYTFVYEGEAESGKLDFEMGVIGEAVPTIIYIDDVIFYRNFNEAE